MGGMTVRLEFPLNTEPRYGHGSPPHGRLFEIIGSRRHAYRRHLQSFLPHAAALRKIPHDPVADPAVPHWNNDFIPPLDAVAIYGLCAQLRPRCVIETGSGNSTEFFRHAIASNRLTCRLISIDPQLRAEVDVLCDEVIRKPLETVPSEFFDNLEAGDIVFFDGSHLVYTNSDVTVRYLEILPALRPGVFVHMHDIFLPEDYPPEWTERYYSEQYLLACYLLSGNPGFEIELANRFVTGSPELRGILKPLWEEPGIPEHQQQGGSFWVRKTGAW
jgi:hypothetical protein